METETLSKLYLELSNVVPPETVSARELTLKRRIQELESGRFADDELWNMAREVCQAMGVSESARYFNPVIEYLRAVNNGKEKI